MERPRRTGNGDGGGGNWRKNRRNIPGNSKTNWRTEGRSQAHQPKSEQFNNSNASGSSNKKSHHSSVQDLSQQTYNRNGTNRQRRQSQGSQPQDVSTNNGGPQTKKHSHVGFKYLDGLMALDDEEFATKLSTQHAGLSDLMRSELSGDLMVLVVRVIRRAANSVLGGVRTVILHAALVDGFIENLKKYVGLLPMQSQRDKRFNAYFWSNPDGFWNDLLEICGVVMTIMPSLSVNVLPKILQIVKLYAPTIEIAHGLKLPEEVKTRVEDLLTTVEDRAKQFHKKEEEKRRQVVRELDPPDDFRTISVLPSSDEILGNRSFLRKNILEGGYTDVDHYLDVQFRLLREDFVGPLRKGIQSYLSDPRARMENVKVYKNVRILCPESENMYHCVRVKFEWDLKKLRTANFENSKRFMFGSLLCFTRDNFQTICFGRVVSRKRQDLEKGELVVGFHDHVDMLNDFQSDFVMVESSVYFEPYYHVLNALQRIEPEEFPMEVYIVSADPDVLRPRYVTDTSVYDIGARRLPVLGHWSDEVIARAKLGLNDNQLKAFKAALSQEFVIIQGPPGTGKTYLGLKIADALITNRQAWRTAYTPMLVVCYTNHALDQFLEGMIPFTGGRIVRIGGQCNNETLQQFNLRELRTYDRNTSTMRRYLKNSMSDIKHATELLKVLQDWKGLLPFNVMDWFSVIPTTSWLAKAGLSDWVNWLFQENDMMKGKRVTTTPLSDRVAETEETDTSDDEEDDGLFKALLEKLHVRSVSQSIFSTRTIDSKIAELEMELEKFAQSNPDEMQVLLKNATAAEEIRQWHNRSLYLQAKLEQLKQDDLHPVKLPDVNWDDPWAMTFTSRWDLYLYVVQTTRTKLPRVIAELDRKFRESYAAFEEIQNVADVRIMRSQLVIGMTTTGAARQRKYLEMLKCPIVIVEEAAEVLEAHIVASITKHCQHLILIGDHQQLQPSTADYDVRTKFGLGVSLFERMVKNNFDCHSLNVQHRMRPEISELIRESIYDTLEDHESVFSRPQVDGLDRCLFFIDHQKEEQYMEGTSKKNVHEAEFLVALAKYLVLNGHAAEKITILAAYLGQMFEIKTKIGWHGNLLKGCRVTALDNYQGEENDLVLLSLVRSNSNNKIGFLAEDNRVCVALSRARNGFYVMGNMTQLCHESHRGRVLWSKIQAKFKQQNAIGSNLALRCQVHGVITEVKSADDFVRVPEGGCSQMCEVTLDCGHKCQSVCHAWDRQHQEYQCSQLCLKNLCDRDDTHLCKNLCSQPCGPCLYPVMTKLDCGHEVELECHIDKDQFLCPVLVSTKLPCDHVANKPCHSNPITFQCPEPCDAIVEPCGHACQLRCHIRKDPDHLEYKCTKRCSKYRKGCSLNINEHICPMLCFEECLPCNTIVLKKRTVCPHAFKVPCHENVDEMTCEKPCQRILPCGHKCDMECGQDCGPCRVIVQKRIQLCGHLQNVECHAAPDRTKCRSKCPLSLPCGHPCTARCNEPCTTQCSEKVTLNNGMLGACGHVVKQIECHQLQKGLPAPDDPALLKNCTEPCGVMLKCDHACAGNCSSCSQGRFHQRCASKCGVPLVCNHLCQNPCREACRSCTEPCPFRCIHSRCKKLCGEVCTMCKELCPRRCRHRRCNNFCGQPCQVSPCEEPCQKLLKCGHKCPGLCSDLCLTKCKECDPDFFEVFFGTEDEPEARFVQLQDCQHIVENSGMVQWLEQASGEIAVKVCPMCKAPIKTTHRYSDYVKKAALDVIQVKVKLAGLPTKNEADAKTLRDKVRLVKRKALNESIKEALECLTQRLMPTRNGKRQAVDKVQLNAITSKVQLIERLVEATGSDIAKAHTRKHTKHVEALLEVIVKRDENYITDQEIEDSSNEIDRLSKIISFSGIDRTETWKITPRVDKMLRRGDALAYAPKAYTQKDDAEFAKILEELKHVFGITLISMAEREEIVKAMGFTKGHWFKCPNGHVYAIGECGGAMQKSKCYECGAEIGGAHHQLLGSNALAPEMDGATYAAYSEMANNLANWHLDDIH